MKHFIQKDFFGCGVYAIANLFQSPKFITEERLNESKSGNNIGQLSKWLQEEQKDIYIDVLYYSIYEDMIPESYFEIKPNEDIFPLLLSVKKTKKSLSHFVSIRVFPNMEIHLHDSTRSDVEIMNFKRLAKEYEVIDGMFCFNSLKEGKYKVIDMDFFKNNYGSK